MGKSILHHAAKLHGYDAETLQAKLAELNLDVGEGLDGERPGRLGTLREGRGPAKSAFFEKRAKDEAAASTLMRESRARIGGQAAAGSRGAGWTRPGRAIEGFGSGHGLGQHAMHAGGLRRQLQNASGVMHRGMMAIDRAATAANNAQSRGPAAAGQRARAPHPDDLDWHAARSSVPSPLTAILAVSAEEGSLASRFGNGIVKLNALRDRASGALRTTRRRLEAHDAGARAAGSTPTPRTPTRCTRRSSGRTPPRRPSGRRSSCPSATRSAGCTCVSHSHPSNTRTRTRTPHQRTSAPCSGARRLGPRLRRGLAAVRHRARAAQAARDGHAARRDRQAAARRGTTTSTTRTTRAPRSRATRCAACCTARRRAPTRRGTSRAVLRPRAPAHERAARRRRGPRQPPAPAGRRLLRGDDRGALLRLWTRSCRRASR